MIVPRTRLILWVSLIVLPFAALAGTMPSTLGVCAVAIGGLFAAVIFDALLARSRVAGIRVELPDLVRLQKDRASQIEVRIHNDAQTARAVRIGLTFPDEISVEDETQTTALPGGSTLSRLDWHCTPRKRGQYFLERAYLEAASPLGFWSARARAIPCAPSCACIRIFSTSGKTSRRCS